MPSGVKSVASDSIRMIGSSPIPPAAKKVVLEPFSKTVDVAVLIVEP
jgi:hypothetical protein